MRYHRFARSPRSAPRTLQRFLARAPKPVRRLPLQLGAWSWRQHLREIYRKSPKLYRLWRSATYSNVIVMRRFSIAAQLDYRAPAAEPVSARMFENGAWVSDRAVLWTYIQRHLQLPIRCGFEQRTDYEYRKQQLQRVMTAENNQAAVARLEEYLESIGWSQLELGHYLNQPASEIIRTRHKRLKQWVLVHYDELLNLPLNATVAFYGDPRLKRGFFPFQQNYAYRRIEYELLRHYHPHTVRTALRPTQSLTAWIDRVRYQPRYIEIARAIRARRETRAPRKRARRAVRSSIRKSPSDG